MGVGRAESGSSPERRAQLNNILQRAKSHLAPLTPHVAAVEDPPSGGGESSAAKSEQWGGRSDAALGMLRWYWVVLQQTAKQLLQDLAKSCPTFWRMLRRYKVPVVLPGTATLRSWPGEGVSASSSPSFAISGEIGVTGKDLRRAADEVGEPGWASGAARGSGEVLPVPSPHVPVGSAPGGSAGTVRVLSHSRRCCMRQAAMENPSECFSLSTICIAAEGGGERLKPKMCISN